MKKPESWKVEPLCAVADVIMGQSPASKYYNFEGEGLPFFQGKTEFGKYYPVAKKWCSKPNKIAQNNDVLISVRAPVGPTNIANQKCCIGRGLAAIRTLDELPHKYILYFLRSIEQQIESLGTGTTFKAISGQTLRSLSIPIAPPCQQFQIVEEIEKQFSRLDETVADLKRVKANLKRYKASVLQAAVTGKLTEEWRKQNPDVEPASKLLERILIERRQKWEEAELARLRERHARGQAKIDENWNPKNDKWKEKYKEPEAPDVSGLSDLLDGWQWAGFDQLITTLRNGLSQKPTESTGLGILRISAVRPLKVHTNDIRFLSSDLLDKYQDYLLENGDLLFTRYNGNPDLVGVCGCVRTLTTNTVYPDKVIRARIVSEEKLSESYLECALNSGESRKFIAGRVRTTAGQSGVSGGDIKQVPVPIASIEEQKAIVQEVESRLSVAEKIQSAVDANLQRAERLRQSILKQAFSGKLI